MKKKKIITLIIITYLIITIIDKLYFNIPTIIYLPLGLLTLFLFIIEFKNSKTKTSIKEKRKDIIITTTITLIILLTYLNPILIYNNYQLVKNIKNQLNNEKININNLIPFDYDKTYIIGPDTSKEQIEKDIGIKSHHIKYNETYDFIQEIIVVKNNKVIASTFISQELTNFNIEPLAKDNYLTPKDNTYFYIHKDKEYNNIYLIETYIKKTEYFYDITYTIPSIWWKEDIDEDDRIYYYLDIEENINHLIIEKKENKFNLKEYKKSLKKEKLNIVDSNETTINNYQAYTFKIIIDENYIEERTIILINNETYIFKLYTHKSQYNEYHQELNKLFESIKI